MKTRVLQKGTWFYPQYKKYFIWWYFDEPQYNSKGVLEPLPVCKLSLERARDYIKDKLKAQLRVVHE